MTTEIKPNKERIRQWVDALRSGEYKQGKGGLRHNDAYCCLGVACDVHSKSTQRSWSGQGSYIGESAILPVEVYKWFGLEEKNPQVCRHHLTWRNDQIKESFLEIADLIEKEWLV